jgi:hypothetical protein
MREKLIKVFCSVLGVKEDIQTAEANDFVDELIANGVTIPVRCKNCKYHKDTSVKEYEHCCLTGKTVMDDDFCSCGENKNDDLSL